MALTKKAAAFLRNTWDKQPILLLSFGVGIFSFFLPYLSPYTKYTTMINQVTPYSYPVPVRDDGNMPDIPSHPCEPKGRSLEWLKNL